MEKAELKSERRVKVRGNQSLVPFSHICDRAICCKVAPNSTGLFGQWWNMQEVRYAASRRGDTIHCEAVKGTGDYFYRKDKGVKS